MEKQRRNILNSKGQTMVEYVLLLSVILTLIAAVFKSDAFQNLWGPESEVFKALRERTEFTYRHGLIIEDISGDKTDNTYSGTHETYYDGQSRFFVPRENYP